MTFWILMFMAGMVQAQDRNKADSLYADSVLPEVRVEASFLERYLDRNQVVAFDSTRLAEAAAYDLAGLLQNQTTAYARQYGPGIATLSLRGTGSNHTAVLWNGLPMQYPSLGTVDFSTVPLLAFDAVELHKGAGGTEFGSGAVGGAVRLRNQRPQGHGFEGRLLSRMGTYGRGLGHHSQMLRLHEAGSRNSWRAGVQYQNDGADYATGAHTESAFATASYYHHPEPEQGHWAAHLWHGHTFRNLPAPEGTADQKARQLDRQSRLALNYESAATSAWRWKATAGYFRDELNYENNVLRSESAAHTVQGRAEVEWRPREGLQLMAGAMPRWVQADVTAYPQAQQRLEWGQYLWSRYQPNRHWLFSVKLRQELISGYDPPLTPSARVQYRFVPNRHVRARLFVRGARSFRVPSFNDLYWPGAGNPDLKPENGRQWEGGTAWDWLHDRHDVHVQLNAYTSRIRNWIQWQPQTGGWQPFNAKQVRHQGMEASFRWRYQPEGAWSVGFQGDYGRTYAEVFESSNPALFPEGRQLMYVPFDTYAGQLRLVRKAFRWTARYSYTGFRYTNPGTPDGYLPAYNLWNFSIAWQPEKADFGPLGANVQLRIDVNNGFNHSYQSYSGYPMPGRNATLNMMVGF